MIMVLVCTLSTKQESRFIGDVRISLKPIDSKRLEKALEAIEVLKGLESIDRRSWSAV